MTQTKDKILNLDALRKQVVQWQSENLKVVFTNGCFDILHLGHVDYLEKARNKGDKLIVGVNTDSSVKKLKGSERPINDQMARARILASLAFVDAVIFFAEDTPYELIEALIPDILVKGNDYLAENIIGANIVKANGGSVETISLVKGYATTNIIKKIKSFK